MRENARRACINLIDSSTNARMVAFTSLIVAKQHVLKGTIALSSAGNTP